MLNTTQRQLLYVRLPNTHSFKTMLFLCVCGGWLELVAQLNYIFILIIIILLLLSFYTLRWKYSNSIPYDRVRYKIIVMSITTTVSLFLISKKDFTFNILIKLPFSFECSTYLNYLLYLTKIATKIIWMFGSSFYEELRHTVCTRWN